MATIAKWGDITFAVNSDKQFTFRDMKRKSSGRWSSHNIIGKRPKTEFLGPDMDEITLEVILDAEYGVKPRTQMYEFRSACKSGEVNYLYVGGKKVCVNKLAISAVTENWEEIWSKGELKRATVSVTFSEYR